MPNKNTINGTTSGTNKAIQQKTRHKKGAKQQAQEEMMTAAETQKKDMLTVEEQVTPNKTGKNRGPNNNTGKDTTSSTRTKITAAETEKIVNGVTAYPLRSSLFQMDWLDVQVKGPTISKKHQQGGPNQEISLLGSNPEP